MRSLFITTHFPQDPERSNVGVFQRMRLMLDALRQVSSHMKVLFLVDPDRPIDKDAIHSTDCALRQWWPPGAATIDISLAHREHVRLPSGLLARYLPGTFSFFHQNPYHYYASDKVVAATTRVLAEGFDLVFAHRLAAMVPLLKIGRSSLPTTFLDLDDVEHVALYRSARYTSQWRSDMLRMAHVPALAVAEWTASRLAHRVFVCSGHDRDHLNRLWMSDKAVRIPNAITIPPTPDNSAERLVCLFLGTYAYRPNAAAAEFLVDHVWPLIRAAHPAAELWLAGPHSEHLRPQLAVAPGVSILGYVADLSALYTKVAVVCCPIRSGSGTRIKIIEAAAYGKAIVSTTLGAEGIELESGRQLLIADTAEAFAARCVELLANSLFRATLGMAAREAARRLHDRINVIAAIRNEMTSFDSRSSTSPSTALDSREPWHHSAELRPSPSNAPENHAGTGS